MNTVSIPDGVTTIHQVRTPPTLLSGLQVIWMLAWREWIRFFRQPFRIIAALGQPVLFWILFGTGMHSSFRGNAESGDFMTYFLPGVAAMILLFTAIFATISIIEDRREGFLQSVMVAPTARLNIAMGKIIGGAAIAWAQALIFLGIAIATGACAIGPQTVGLVAFTLLAAIAITSLGVCCAWPMDSTQGFHALMNMVLMPMWLLSGSFFPVPSLTNSMPVGQAILHWVMRCNPMTYVVAGMRSLMSGADAATNFWTPSLTTSVLITIGFAAAATVVATIIVSRKQKGELQ